MNQFKKGDRVIVESLFREHPLFSLGKFKGTVLNSLPEVKNVESSIPYEVLIDGYSDGGVYPFLAHEMTKISGEKKKRKEDAQQEKDDVISHPSHYTQGIECMDYIESHKLNYARGNVIKYVTRAGLKDVSKEVEDLEKARWYLDRGEIERVKKAKKDG